MNEQQVSRIKEILREQPIALAYLYGSQARKKAGPLSDVDIAVLFNHGRQEDAGSMEKYSQLHGALQKEAGREVDLVDLAEVKSPLLRHRIVFRGKLLHCASQKARRNFENKVLREYEDTRYLRAAQSRIMRRQIRVGKEEK